MRFPKHDGRTIGDAHATVSFTLTLLLNRPLDHLDHAEISKMLEKETGEAATDDRPTIPRGASNAIAAATTPQLISAG